MPFRVTCFTFFVVLLASVNMATDSGSEITLTGKPPEREINGSNLGEARPNLLGSCVDITKDVADEIFLIEFRKHIAQEVGINLEDFSTRPDLLTIEECNNIFVVSTVNSVNTSGKTLRFFFAVNDVARKDFLARRFGPFVFLMN